MYSAATVVTMKKMTLAKASQNQGLALAREVWEMCGSGKEYSDAAGVTADDCVAG